MAIATVTYICRTNSNTHVWEKWVGLTHTKNPMKLKSEKFWIILEDYVSTNILVGIMKYNFEKYYLWAKKRKDWITLHNSYNYV
jgi:hypothetical protein